MGTLILSSLQDLVVVQSEPTGSDLWVGSLFGFPFWRPRISSFGQGQFLVFGGPGRFVVFGSFEQGIYEKMRGEPKRGRAEK